MRRRSGGAGAVIRVAVLGGAWWRGGPLAEGELPPPEAADYALFAPAAARVGLMLELRRWDAPGLAEEGFDAALIRACWDYPDRPAAFLDRLDALTAAGLPVLNPAALVRWNARKTYLQDLAARGAPTIDTLWLERVDAHTVARGFSDLDAAEVVLKPQVGAGSRRTIRLKRNAWSEHDLIGGPEGPAMLQPFLPAIEIEGEWSVFVFGGAPAHTIHKRPAPGGWYANVDGARFARADAPPDVTALARDIAALAPPGLLYARVDMVRGLDGRMKLIELEAIEPYLFLTYAPEAADAFARALVAALPAVLSG